VVAGKTTLLRLLAGLDEPAYGELDVAATDGTVVFQDPRLLPWKRTWENVVLGIGALGTRERRATAALAEVALGHRADAWAADAFGRRGAARSGSRVHFVREPALLLLDEPFASLDALTRMRMHVLVEALWRRHGPAVLLVTHDVDEAILACRCAFSSSTAAASHSTFRSRFRAPALAGVRRLLRSSPYLAHRSRVDVNEGGAG